MMSSTWIHIPNLRTVNNNLLGWGNVGRDQDRGVNLVGSNSLYSLASHYFSLIVSNSSINLMSICLYIYFYLFLCLTNNIQINMSTYLSIYFFLYLYLPIYFSALSIYQQIYFLYSLYLSIYFSLVPYILATMYV